MSRLGPETPPGPCPSCAAPIEHGWRHCGSCGQRLVDDDRPEESRVVTMVISDLQGSTALAETLDPESLRLVLDRYFDELGVVFESHGGHIEKRIGDAMVTAFGFPVASDDDALRALRATIEGQQTLANLNEHLHAGWGVRLVNRTGIATGTVVYASASGAHRVLAGEPFDLAGGLEPLAPPLEALVSAETVAIVGDAASFGPVMTLTLKSGREVQAYQLLDVSFADDDPPVASPTATDTVTGTATDTAACAACGTPRTAAHAWCTTCGLPLDSGTRRIESRRTVTVVFADLSLAHTRDGVTATQERAAMLRVFDTARLILEHHGGVVENFIGDAAMAIYGLEQRHEDDGLRAVRAAWEMQARLADLQGDLDADFGVRLIVKIGVNTGAVIAGDPGAGERLVTGDAVNVAARLEQTAAPGDVVIGELTRRLAGAGLELEALAPLTLKGKAEPVHAFRVLGLAAPGTTRRSFELPLTGRSHELAALDETWADAKQGGGWQRIAVVGEAGAGKSRLVHELLDHVVGDERVLRGACLPYGEGITFWPIAEIIRAAADVTAGSDVDASLAAVEAVSPDHEVAVRLQALLGLTDRRVPVPEIFWAVRRLLDHLAMHEPLVVVIDGLHWAEPTLLDLLDDLVANGAAVPALLVTMERPSPADEQLDEQLDVQVDEEVPTSDVPAGATTTTSVRTLRVNPLDEDQCTDLLVAALGEDALPTEVRERIVRASGGIPLFVEQLLTMLIGDGQLVRDGAGWRATASINDLAVPPTIEALLAARVDALGDDERAVLQPASVIGRSFPSGAVAHLTHVSDIAAPLAGLGRRQLVTALPGNDPLADHRFRNLMIRDVVYDGLLKRQRSGLHREFADWMVHGPTADRIGEIEEILGYHLERAFLLGAEVATVDDGLVEVGRRAAEHLGNAGRRAFIRGDMPAAGNLLERAARTLHGGGPRASELLVLAGDAVFETGAFTNAAALYDEAEQMATNAADEHGIGVARLARCTMRYLTGDGVADDEALSTASELLAVFERADDEASIARCWRLRAYVDMTACRWGDAAVAAFETIRHAQQAEDHELERRLRPALADFALYGPTPVPEVLRLCEELLANVGSDSRARAKIEQTVAHVLGFEGRFDEARDHCVRARSSLLELGWNFDAALVSIHLAPVELMADDPAAAEAALAADYRTLTEMGEQNYVSTTAAFLAEAVRRQGRHAEAAALVTESALMAAPDDVFTQLAWRSTKTMLEAEDGRLDEALAVAREAVELAMATDSPGAQGTALLDLAQVLTLCGDRARAEAVALDAQARFSAKADGAGLRRAATVLAEINGPATAS